MLSFDFTYQEHQIRYTVDFMGREKVYLNEELIAKPTQWFKSVNSVTINTNNETLKLHRTISSWSSGEYQITLTNNKRIIEKHSQFFFDKRLGDHDEKLIFKGHESQWVEEIKPPQRTLKLAFLFYMLSVLYSLTEGLFEQNWALPLILVAGGIILGYSVFDFIRSAISALFSEDKGAENIEAFKM
ncbi:hypothetical protein [Thalassotalea euphylliae]|uniref:Uncharacterized protein n=1 Tax=Thalassotalea euphylliae TaxID=1655234 RepID=A0A3E0U6T6_9GAMM|nr:hypothetical protein [Thalassotalea euphylliae]REL31642.1 hypothetical protein DXX94_13445 [Thalassotalea euphylliae]